MLFYKIMSRKMAIGKEKGEERCYASVIATDYITTEQVEERIEKRTALSKADVRAAITALSEVVQEELLAGHAVDLGDLGSFKVVSMGKFVKSKAEVTPETLKTPRIKFFPKREMREKARNVRREIQGMVHSTRECPMPADKLAPGASSDLDKKQGEHGIINK